MARVLRHKQAGMQPQSEKPSWVEALEESLLLAISLFALITWIVTVGLLGH